MLWGGLTSRFCCKVSSMVLPQLSSMFAAWLPDLTTCLSWTINSLFVPVPDSLKETQHCRWIQLGKDGKGGPLYLLASSTHWFDLWFTCCFYTTASSGNTVDTINHQQCHMVQHLSLPVTLLIKPGRGRVNNPSHPEGLNVFFQDTNPSIRLAVCLLFPAVILCGGFSVALAVYSLGFYKDRLLQNETDPLIILEKKQSQILLCQTTKNAVE